MARVRVAAVQYFIRPVDRFEAFRTQVESLVDTAKDYAYRGSMACSRSCT